MAYCPSTSPSGTASLPRGAEYAAVRVLMHVPQLADRVCALEDYFRFDGDLPAC
jgi:hypothetical protein